MVEDRPGITVTEIADKYRRSRSRVSRYWVTNPEWKRRVRAVGQRGRAKEYHADDVHKLLREWVWLPPEEPGLPPERLLTQSEIADYAGIGLETVRADATEAKGVLGPPDSVLDGVRMWRRDTVDERYWARQFRKREAPQAT